MAKNFTEYLNSLSTKYKKIVEPLLRYDEDSAKFEMMRGNVKANIIKENARWIFDINVANPAINEFLEIMDCLSHTGIPGNNREARKRYEIHYIIYYTSDDTIIFRTDNTGIITCTNHNKKTRDETDNVMFNINTTDWKKYYMPLNLGEINVYSSEDQPQAIQFSVPNSVEFIAAKLVDFESADNTLVIHAVYVCNKNFEYDAHSEFCRKEVDILLNRQWEKVSLLDLFKKRNELISYKGPTNNNPNSMDPIVITNRHCINENNLPELLTKAKQSAK